MLVSKSMAEHTLFERRSALVGMNAAWLRQALRLLDEIDDEAYSGAGKVGGQFRHVVEFYECFLNGLSSRHIDYDARRRDQALEENRRAAATRIETLIDRLTMEPELRADGIVFVRVEDAATFGMPEPYLTSSVGRELQALSSHTIHHFALIALTLRASGWAVDQDFGVSPSTLRHRAQLTEAA